LTEKDVQTEIDDALERVREEKVHVGDKTEAYRSFRCSIEEVEFRKRLGAKGRSSALESRPTDACEEVVRSFAETVRPYSVEEVDGAENVLETVSEELGAEMAFALSPKTDAVPPKDAVMSSVDERAFELEVLPTRSKTRRLRYARHALWSRT